jgi:hypothetical protein
MINVVRWIIYVTESVSSGCTAQIKTQARAKYDAAFCTVTGILRHDNVRRRIANNAMAAIA